MGISDRFPRLLAKRPAGGPRSKPRAGGKPRDLWSKRNRDGAQLDLYDRIYEQGGLITEAIDQYPLSILSAGYTLQAKPGYLSYIDRVEDVFDRVDIEQVMHQGILEAIKTGDSFQELVGGRGSMRDELVSVITRASKDFDIDHDEYGIVTGYTQHVGSGFLRETIPFRLDEMLHLQLFPVAGSVYGKSLIGQALDDISRDTWTADGTTEAIKRHGFRRHQVKVGQPGEKIPQKDIDDVYDEYTKLDKQTEIVTQHDVEIVTLDQGSLEIKGYYEWSVERLCTALGEPCELLGLGRGSTEATAKVRLRAWASKIGTLQQRAARQLNRQLVDRITGVPGAVWLQFNRYAIEDQMYLAQYVQALTSNSVDPWYIISRDEARQVLGFMPDEQDDDVEIDEEAADG